MADWYSKFEMFSFQGTVTCLNMVDSFNAKRLLEVGCGPGLHSELIAKSFTPEKGLLVSCDFSPEMVNKMKTRYGESEFAKEEGVSVRISTEVDHTESSDSQCEGLNEEFDGKRVIGCVVDNMRLPFESNFFDGYVSNLSMMIVPNPDKQISECYRVLKAKSRACFTVWGRREGCKQFTIMTQALKNLGREVPDAPARNNFTDGNDPEGTKKKFEAAGFNEVKMWY